MEGKSLILKTFGILQLIYNMQGIDFKAKHQVQVERIILS